MSKSCSICNRPIHFMPDPLSMDCGGHCWGCIRQDEALDWPHLDVHDPRPEYTGDVAGYSRIVRALLPLMNRQEAALRPYLHARHVRGVDVGDCYVCEAPGLRYGSDSSIVGAISECLCCGAKYETKMIEDRYASGGGCYLELFARPLRPFRVKFAHNRATEALAHEFGGIITRRDEMAFARIQDAFIVLGLGGDDALELGCVDPERRDEYLAHIMILRDKIEPASDAIAHLARVRQSHAPGSPEYKAALDEVYVVLRLSAGEC